MPKTITLYELNHLVHQTLAFSMPDEYWVEAEVSEIREVRGHCYMELVQKDEWGNTPIAKASAKCWKNKWTYIRPHFERIAGRQLRAGMKILVKVYADFHEAFGFSWIVTDIDPTFTMGDMARKRQEIIRRLKEAGVYDLQKELQIPMFAQRIAVISSENAAGYGDFCDQLFNNEYALKFSVRLFPAIMQGEQVEESIIQALDSINEEADLFDVVVIIRGGGATSDLSGFDTLSLAENVANFPLPIITGIGHDRDESVLDMVSHTRVKTPTAAAALLVDHLSAVYERVWEAQERISHVVRRRMDWETMRLSKIAEKIPVLFSLVKGKKEAEIDRLHARLHTQTTRQLATCRHQLDVLARRLTPAIERQMLHENHRLEVLEHRIVPAVERYMLHEVHRLDILSRRVQILDPVLLLKRGYSITLYQGKIIRDIAEVKTGDEIETRMEKGSIRSVVK